MGFIADFFKGKPKTEETNWASYVEKKAYEEEKIKLAERIGKEKALEEYKNRNKKTNNSIFGGAGASLKDFAGEMANNMDEFQKQNFGDFKLGEEVDKNGRSKRNDRTKI